MFGVDKPIPGILLFKSEKAANLDNEQFLDAVWPTIHEANIHAEGFSQISRDMVIILGPDVDYPSTDKMAIKRAQVYLNFQNEIEDVYVQMEKRADGPLVQLLKQELENWILERLQVLGINVPDVEADFFTSGIDSLRAIQMRGLIVKYIDIGDHTLGSMIVYDCGNATKLAQKLYELRNDLDGGEDGDEKEIALMEKLIERFSTFDAPPQHQDLPSSPTTHEGNVVILTGATGSLGSHLLNQLVSPPTVSKIYCLIRPSSTSTISAHDRLSSVLKERMMLIDLSKVTTIFSDLSLPNLGLPTETLALLKGSANHIIHCAWAVNFVLPVSSFEPQLQALHNLLAFTLTQSEPALLQFCSSIGAAMAWPPPYPAIVPESPIPGLRYASATGLARSKLVGERVMENAVKKYGARATVMRIGQIVPAREFGSGVWNVNEAIPLIIRSATTLDALPDKLGPSGDDICTWLEAGVLAKSIVELAGLGGGVAEDGKQLVYNLVNPRPFSWRGEFVPALKAVGLKFVLLSWEEWLKKVEAETNVEKNPSRKLLGFWNGKRSATEQDTVGQNQREVKFETTNAVRKSEALRYAPRVVDGVSVGRLTEAWKDVWWFVILRVTMIVVVL